MSVSIQDKAYSIDFVENGNMPPVRFVPRARKEFPKSWRSVKPDCWRSAIVASSRQRRGGCNVPESHRETRNNPVIYFGIRKNVRMVRCFTVCRRGNFAMKRFWGGAGSRF
jgi:hypothetical protein